MVDGFFAYRVLRRRAYDPRRSPILKTRGFAVSSDGSQWWDGAAWHDANQEVPPGAQQDPSNRFWWDGFHWRPVPLLPPDM